VVEQRPAAVPRYFVYVSDSKLNLIFEQIEDGERQRFSAEVKVDLKIVSVTLRPDSPPDTRLGKLRIVERYLEQEGKVGTVDDDTPYFRGMMQMHHGPLGSPETSNIQLFLARTRDRTVALAGSRKHVWGQQGMVQMQAWSAIDSITAAIGEHISADPELGETIKAIRRGRIKGVDEFGAAVLNPPHSALPSVDLIWLIDPTGETEPPPAQNLEFLAKRLLDGEIESGEPAPAPGPAAARKKGQRVRVTIGTPIYVAQAD
jgi:uncharacterized protein DUF7019